MFHHCHYASSYFKIQANICDISVVDRAVDDGFFATSADGVGAVVMVFCPPVVGEISVIFPS
jgi:hypothetical protein